MPRDQRPVNELRSLRETFLYDWALLPAAPLALRCGALFLAVFVLLSAPISDATFEPTRQPAQFLLASTAGSLAVLTAVLARVYLGWAYVGNRLLSAVIEYEETGWYDGQLFVKPPKVLARDRLLGAYEVKPALGRLKGLLLASGLTLAGTAVSLSVLLSQSTDADGFYGRGAGVPVYRLSADLKTEDAAIEALEQLRSDDAAAAEEADAIRESLGEVPAWCAERYYKAMAGSASIDCDALSARAREARAE